LSIFAFRVAAVAQTAGEVANARLAAHALARVAPRILSVDKALAAQTSPDFVDDCLFVWEIAGGKF
jgi:hypothetical protein